jgi:cytochrome c-type biogenesis protein CcmE
MSAVAVDKSPSDTRRKVMIVAVAVLAVAIVLWLILFLTVGGDFYKTVEEATAEGAQSGVRVGGVVAVDSVVQDARGARFVLEGENGTTLDVRYVGPFPERLRAHEQAVVLGSLGSDGVFEATEVLVKCPDALFPEKVTNTVLTGAGLERILY